jgi:hypothetical protein
MIAICVNNTDCEASLIKGKYYKVASPKSEDPIDWIRIIDETGEDYLYSEDRFIVYIEFTK